MALNFVYFEMFKKLEDSLDFSFKDFKSQEKWI
jgi:hypothetical protein